MTSAEVHSSLEVSDLMLFQDNAKAIAIKDILNNFLVSNSSIIEESVKNHYKLFYENEKDLVFLLSSYLNEDTAGWLVREIGLNCYTYDMGISMNGFEVVEVKYVENKGWCK